MKIFRILLAALVVSSFSLSVAFAGGLEDEGIELVAPADQTMVPNVYANVNGETRFEWTETALSEEDFDYYTLCFRTSFLNVDYRCFNTGQDTFLVMTAEDWKELDQRLVEGGMDDLIQIYIEWQVNAHSKDSGAVYKGKESRGLNYLRNYDDLIPLTDLDVETRQGKAAGWLYLKEIISGHPDKTFRGENLVNRAEALKIVLKAAEINIEDGLKNDGKYSDLNDENDWFVKYVMKATKMGVVKGYPNGTFGPEQGVNTVEFVKMLTEVFNLNEDFENSFEDVAADDWFAPYAGVAEKYELFPDRMNKLMPDKQLNRYEVAEAVSQVLKSFDVK